MTLLKKPIVIFLLLIVALFFFYNNSFSAPFYREDAEFLRISLPQDLLTPIPAIHYHPISNQVFYYFSKVLFGSNYFFYHLVLFAFYAGGLFFAYKLSKNLTNTKDALVLVFFYAFNISFFPIFYWIAVSYFAISAFFLFAALYYFDKGGKYSLVTTSLLTLFALWSNEASIVIFGLFWLLAWFKRQLFTKNILALSAIGLSYFLIRFILFPLPIESAYKMHFDWQIIKTVQWYVLRGLNLPEGIRFSGDHLLLGSFIILVICLAVATLIYLRGKTNRPTYRLLLLGGAWFIIGAAPFYLLPNHMSAYYLTYAFFGLGLIMTRLLRVNQILLVVSLICYFILAVRGLDFLEKTHWIILKNAGEVQKFYTIEEAYDNRN